MFIGSISQKDVFNLFKIFSTISGVIESELLWQAPDWLVYLQSEVTKRDAAKKA